MLSAGEELKRTPSGGHTRVRRAEPEDAAQITALLLASFAEYQSLYTEQAFAATTPTVEQVAGRMAEGPVWLALSSDSIVGTASAVPRGEGLYVRSMAVLAEARGGGAGDLLLQQVEEFALAHGHTRLFLSTTPFLTRAIRLYERWGFRRTAQGPHDLFGTPLFTMEKDLATAEDRR